MSSIDFTALQEFIFSQKMTPDNTVHGIDHWTQVESNALLLSRHTGADETVIRLFSIFHDSRRFDDGYDSEHGPRAAEFLMQIRGDVFVLDDARFDLLYHACYYHTKEHSSGDKTIDTCYDADRLDLGRVGIQPKQEKMATAIGQKIVKKAKDVPLSEMRQWLNKLTL
jgi:uncharacterized protein